MRESLIETRLTTLAAKHKLICWKWSSSRRGVPDRVMIARGKVVFVELKATNQKITLQQAHVHRLMQDQAAEVVVVDSLEAVDALIARLTA
jgi:hypothetical protein